MKFKTGPVPVFLCHVSTTFALIKNDCIYRVLLKFEEAALWHKSLVFCHIEQPALSLPKRSRNALV
jgi:hypothetical protein